MSRFLIAVLAPGKFFTPYARIHATNFPRACTERGPLRGANGTSAVLLGSLEELAFVVLEEVFDEPPHAVSITVASTSVTLRTAMRFTRTRE